MKGFGSRLCEELKRAAEEIGGWQALEERLQKIAKLKKPLISRKQLSRMATHGDYPIKLKQLEILDQFFQEEKKGRLVDMLVAPSVIDLMGAHGDVTFILGSQPDQDAVRIDVSRWDIRSFAEILAKLQWVRRGLRISFEDVISRDFGDARIFGRASGVPRNERWWHLLKDREFGASVVCLGSGKANHASEVAHSDMFGLKPFKAPAADAELPFAFVWPDDDVRVKDLPSCTTFSSTVHREQLLALEGCDQKCVSRLKKRDSKTSGLMAGEKYFEVHRPEGKKKWRTYGVLSASKEEGRVILCVAGLTGTATLGGAMLLNDFVLGEGFGVGDKRVAWVPYSVSVREVGERSEGFRKDKRRIGTARLEGDVKYFSAGS